jgi:hypothetical protein
MKTENQELLTNWSHSRAETLEDLPVAEARQDEVKGGEAGWAQKSVIATIPSTTT